MVQGHGELGEFYSCFTCCSRRVFLSVYGTENDKQHSVMFILVLRRLRRYWFVFLSLKTFWSRFNVFRRAPFNLAVFYANWLLTQLFRTALGRVFIIFLFHSGSQPPARTMCAFHHNVSTSTGLSAVQSWAW